MCEFNRHGILADIEALRQLPQRSRPKEDTMPFTRRKLLYLGGAAAIAATAPSLACAQSYPTRPVRMIVGFAAGGPTDIVARIMAQWLSERLGQQFVIENRLGASGNIATEAALRAPPDGYTLLQVTSSNAVNVTLYEKS